VSSRRATRHDGLDDRRRRRPLLRDHQHLRAAPTSWCGVSFDWGEPAHCEELLGDVFELEITNHNTPWIAETPDEIWELVSESFGPIKTLLGVLPPERAEAFRIEMLDYLEEEQTEDGIGLDRLYILVVGTRKS
jgi:hypothetical protein